MTTAVAEVASSQEAPVPERYAWDLPVPRNPTILRRAMALLVDSLVVLALTYAVVLVLAATGVYLVPELTIDGVGTNRALGFFWLGLLLELPVNLLYFTLLEGTTGQTLGKMLSGLRVQTVLGGRPGVFDAFIRNLLRLLWITPFGPAFILLDAYAVHVTELDQRIGDLAARTTVVDERDAHDAHDAEGPDIGEAP